MGKTKTKYQCTQCGNVVIKWAGQCPECREWNTLEEKVEISSSNSKSEKHQNWSGKTAEVTQLSSVGKQDLIRVSSGIKEFDQVMGGSIVQGSVNLVGGDPGIGKSTLLLQVVLSMSQKHKVLYITGEESIEQVKERADRLSFDTSNAFIFAETDMNKIAESILYHKPEVVIVDSIQTLFTATYESAPGTVTQVRECASALTQIAKQNNIATFLIGHVTKEGNIAGPKVLEHIVDAVISFEGNSKNNIRLLKPQKNRFGSTNEMGAFILTDKGAEPVENPATLFLNDQYQPVPGSCIFGMQEGKNCIFIEIQALVDDSQSHQKILTVGTEFNRTAMVMAVLYKKLSVDDLSMAHIYVNAVGGIKIDDTGVDLATACATLTAIKNKSLPEKTIVFGEIGLTGEVRGVSEIDERLKEISKNGFENVIMPHVNIKNDYGLKIIKIKYLSNLETLFREL